MLIINQSYIDLNLKFSEKNQGHQITSGKAVVTKIKWINISGKQNIKHKLIKITWTNLPVL